MTHRRSITLLAVLAVAACLALTAWAQGGPGKACGTGGCAVSQSCPMTNQQKCCMQGGWWTTAKPKTPAQKAFVADIAQRFEQIRAKQLECATLSAGNASQEQMTTVQNEMKAMCAGMCDVMKRNEALRKQLGAPDCGNCACATGKCNGCPMGYCAMGAGQGGWWTRVQPKTDAEKAFVADVTALHQQIVAAQSAGDQAKANALRAKLHDVMYSNRALHQQLMMSAGGRGMGMGMGRGQGMGCGMGNGQGKGRGCCPLAK